MLHTLSNGWCTQHPGPQSDTIIDPQTRAAGKPLWVSFTIEDSSHARLRSGQPLADAVSPLLAHPHLEALLLNCCAPGAVSAALPVLRAAAPARVRVGAYANGFKTTTTEWLTGGQGPRLDADEGDYDAASGVVTTEAYARFARHWRRAGASIIGGCCGVGPEHIHAVAVALAGT